MKWWVVLGLDMGKYMVIVIIKILIFWYSIYMIDKVFWENVFLKLFV